MEQSLSTGSGLLYEREITFYALWDNTFWSLFIMATKAFTLILDVRRETSPTPNQSVQSLSNWRRNGLLETKTINAHCDSCWQYMCAMITMHQLHSATVFTVPASRPDCVVWNSQPRNAFFLCLLNTWLAQVFRSPQLTEVPIIELFAEGADELNQNPL